MKPNWNRKSTTSKGREGEARAALFLETRGYRVVQRNLRLPGGEIDLVCVEGGVLVFVEVKRRDGTSFGDAFSAVDATKRRRLRAIAADYAQIVAPGREIRFDIVALDGNRVSLHRNAL